MIYDLTCVPGSIKVRLLEQSKESLSFINIWHTTPIHSLRTQSYGVYDEKCDIDIYMFLDSWGQVLLKKKKKSKISKIWPGCQFLKFLIFFFLPKFQSFTKNDPESSIFIAFTSSLFQNVCNFYRYATIYFFLKKYRVKRGEGGQNGGKNPHFW